MTGRQPLPQRAMDVLVDKVEHYVINHGDLEPAELVVVALYLVLEHLLALHRGD